MMHLNFEGLPANAKGTIKVQNNPTSRSRLNSRLADFTTGVFKKCIKTIKKIKRMIIDTDAKIMIEIVQKSPQSR